MAAAIPFLQIAGTVMSVVGALSQGQASADASNYNRAINERNATVATQQAAADEARQRRENLLRAGNLRAGYGASGVTVDGSPLDVLEMAATNGELDAQSIRYKGNLRAMGYNDTATLDGMAADNAKTSSYYKASSELLAGGAKAYGSFNGLSRKGSSFGPSDDGSMG